MNRPGFLACCPLGHAGLRNYLREMNDHTPAPPPPAPAEPRGCLFALSQPPLMLFLTVVGGLIFGTSVYDLIGW